MARNICQRQLHRLSCFICSGVHWLVFPRYNWLSFFPSIQSLVFHIIRFFIFLISDHQEKKGSQRVRNLTWMGRNALCFSAAWFNVQFDPFVYLFRSTPVDHIRSTLMINLRNTHPIISILQLVKATSLYQIWMQLQFNRDIFQSLCFYPASYSTLPLTTLYQYFFHAKTLFISCFRKKCFECF